MLGPLTEEGTWEIRLLPLEDWPGLSQRQGLSIGYVFSNAAPPQGLPLILVPPRHWKAYFYTIKPFYVILQEEKKTEKTSVSESIKAINIF